MTTFGRDILVLGIETSCDETAAAVVRRGRDVLSNVIASQHDLHAEYSGVVPEIASRAHAERVLPVVQSAVREAGVALGAIDAVAVGHRPGLIGSLLVGVSAAKALAWSLHRPLIGVDHVHAHLYAGCLGRELPAFPALGLVVSGGHTSLYRLTNPAEPVRLGATIDDAVGEAFDKVATILGLPYPGGPNLDRLAQSAPAGEGHGHDFPISRLGRDSLDFSFSGLKTAVLYAVRGVPSRGGDTGARHSPLDGDEKARIAAAFQQAAIAAVMLKLERALERHPECRAILVGGGVSANSLLRERLTTLGRERGLDVRLPAMQYCVDNAAMIAGLAAVLLDRRGEGEGTGATFDIAEDLKLSAVPTTAC